MNTLKKNTNIVGIDLGTTNTVMAFMDDTGKPKIIPNLDGDMKTPSIVHFGDNGDEVLTGRDRAERVVIEVAERVGDQHRIAAKLTGVEHSVEGPGLTAVVRVGHTRLRTGKAAYHSAPPGGSSPIYRVRTLATESSSRCTQVAAVGARRPTRSASS